MTSGVPYRFETLTLKEIRKPSDLPQGAKIYVVQFFEEYSVHHEGDERSRTNPGHGYPAYTESGIHIRQFGTLSEEEWRKAINALYVADKGRSDVIAFVMTPARVATTIQVEIG